MAKPYTSKRSDLLTNKQLLQCLSFFLWFIPTILFVNYQVKPFLETVRFIVPSDMLKMMTGYSRFDVLHATVPSILFLLFVFFVLMHLKNKFIQLNIALRSIKNFPEKAIDTSTVVSKTTRYFWISHALIFFGFLLVFQQFYWVVSKA